MLITPTSGPIPDGPLHIGDVADLTGLSLRSIRHYEELGLVTPVRRTSGGFRVFDTEAVERLRLVMELRLVGLSLEDIKPIVDACRACETGTGDDADAAALTSARDQVTAALHDLERRLAPARALQRRLAAATPDE